MCESLKKDPGRQAACSSACSPPARPCMSERYGAASAASEGHGLPPGCHAASSTRCTARAPRPPRPRATLSRAAWLVGGLMTGGIAAGLSGRVADPQPPAAAGGSRPASSPQVANSPGRLIV
jgi:hypothetical protein